MIPVLVLTPNRLRARQHIGLPVVFDDFDMMAVWGSRPTWIDPTGDASKDKARGGGIALGTYAGNRRTKRAWQSGRALSLDFDDAGDVDRIADALPYSCIIHETYSSTSAAPRCRAYLELAEPIMDVAIFDRAHAVVRRHLAAAGAVADDGAKDCSRLNYVPCRARGMGYRFRRVEGEPLDVSRMLAAAPPPSAPTATVLPLPQNRDRYIAAALQRARLNVASASPGGRHLALGREAYSLARLGLREHEIRDALLPAFVAAAGEKRRAEGARFVRDAIRARRGAR